LIKDVVEVQMCLKDGKRKVLTFSYDDGNTQDIRLIEILNRYGLKGTFNVNTGLFLNDASQRDGEGKLTWNEAEELFNNSGHEVAVHTLTHPWIASLKSHEAIKEITEDRKNIEKHFCSLGKGMAYPYGCYSDETLEVLKLCGIVYSRTTKSTHSFIFPENWLELHPTCHHNDAGLMALADKFINDDPRWGICNMFYVWGHSYEFDRNDNWDLIEKFAEKISGKEDIWYATNIEIYDYVKAYERLEASADNTIVCNPSAVPVWFFENGNTYKIEPGEKLIIK